MTDDDGRRAADASVARSGETLRQAEWRAELLQDRHPRQERTDDPVLPRRAAARRLALTLQCRTRETEGPRQAARSAS